MRRLLPLSLCAAAFFSLTACDQGSVSEPETAEEQALFDFRNNAQPDNPAFDGDVEIQRNRDDDSDGPGVGDDILWDIVDEVTRDSAGTEIQTLNGSTIASPTTGETLCTITDSPDGLFKQLRDADGTVLFSTMGIWAFDGEIVLQGNAFQQYQTLANALRFTFVGSNVVEGFAGWNPAVVETSSPIQLSSRSRKATIAGLIDGYCGSDGMDD